VGGFTGFLQADGYEVYDRLATDRDDLVLVGCWAHARRKAVSGPSTANRVEIIASQPRSDGPGVRAPPVKQDLSRCAVCVASSAAQPARRSRR
jgi:hypothetical protein